MSGFTGFPGAGAGANPFSGADKVQADGRKAWIGLGRHHFKLSSLEGRETADPNKRAGTYVVIATLECMNTDAAKLVPPTIVGRETVRTFVLLPVAQCSKTELGQRTSTFAEYKRLVMSLFGIESHNEESFTAIGTNMGMSQDDLLLACCGVLNPIAGQECFCEGVEGNIPKGGTTPFVNLNWYPVPKV